MEIDKIPNWAKDNAMHVVYNTYRFIKNLDNRETFPSSRLLYESLKCFDKTDNIVELLSNVVKKYGRNNIVWGFKKYKNHCRWELYEFHYDKYNQKIESNIGFNLRDEKLDINKDVVIHSFDVEIGQQTIGDELHLYCGDNHEKKMPYFGVGKVVKNDIIKHESFYVIDKQQDCIDNFKDYSRKINCDESVLKFSDNLKKYKCYYNVICNKNPTEIYIMYIGISVNDFINFLKEYKYPEQYVLHVDKNIEKYRNINHEVTIVFDIESEEPIRTAIFGIL